MDELLLEEFRDKMLSERKFLERNNLFIEFLQLERFDRFIKYTELDSCLDSLQTWGYLSAI